MSERTQCERCKEWERMGLSPYCPSCDAAHYDDELDDLDVVTSTDLDRVETFLDRYLPKKDVN